MSRGGRRSRANRSGGDRRDKEMDWRSRWARLWWPCFVSLCREASAARSSSLPSKCKAQHRGTFRTERRRDSQKGRISIARTDAYGYTSYYYLLPCDEQRRQRSKHFESLHSWSSSTRTWAARFAAWPARAGLRAGSGPRSRKKPLIHR